MIRRKFGTHPGIALQDELHAQNMTQAELARRTGYSKKHINRVIRGHHSIVSDMAVQLERVLKVPATFWIGLQSNYDLAQARERLKRG